MIGELSMREINPFLKGARAKSASKENEAWRRKSVEERAEIQPQKLLETTESLKSVTFKN